MPEVLITECDAAGNRGGGGGGIPPGIKMTNKSITSKRGSLYILVAFSKTVVLVSVNATHVKSSAVYDGVSTVLSGAYRLLCTA